MNRAHRITRIAVGSLLTLALVLSVLATIDGGASAKDSGVLSPIGWVSITLGLAALWLVALVLLGVDRRHDDADSNFVSRACPHCEREVLGRWRICPYCGSRLEDAESEGQA